MNKDLITKWLDGIAQFGLVIVIFFTLFGFWEFSADRFETPKFLVASAYLIILSVLFILRFIVQGKIIINSTPLDISFIGLLLVATISTFLSQSKQLSLFGEFLKINGSLSAVIVCVLMFFLLMANIKSVKYIRYTISCFLIGGAILSILSLFSFFGISYLPFNWTNFQNFTPTGSNFSTAAFLVLNIPFLMTTILRTESLPTKALYAILFILFGFTLALTAAVPVLVVGLVVLLLTLWSSTSRDILKNKILLAALFVLFLSLPAVLFFPNPVSANYQSFSKEIQLSLNTSWSIAISVFRDSPFWGTGPHTFLDNFIFYKPASFNSEKFWNLTFDQASNEYLHVLATLGGAGLLVFLMLSFRSVSAAFRVLSQGKKTEAPHIISQSLALSVIAFFLLLLFHPSTLVLWLMGIIILACFININRNSLVKQLNISLGNLIRESDGTVVSSIDILPLVISLLIGCVVIFNIYIVGSAALADYHYQRAVKAPTNVDAYKELLDAQKLNSQNDLYQISLSQVNLGIVNDIMVAKGSTQASPSGSLSDADKQDISQIIQQAIAEGKASVALNPKSAGNWENLGSIYRQISGIDKDSLQFSLDAYTKAIERDPTNPSLRLNVGSLYYLVKDYDQAIRFFSDSISLKPDFANGYFNLSFALRDKGDLKSAQSAAEKALSLIDPNSADYKAIEAYLTDLKARVAASASEPSSTTPSSLQNATSSAKTKTKK